jgi:DNA-binding response OmpR family regulator
VRILIVETDPTLRKLMAKLMLRLASTAISITTDNAVSEDWTTYDLIILHDAAPGASMVFRALQRGRARSVIVTKSQVSHVAWSCRTWARPFIARHLVLSALTMAAEVAEPV